MSNQIRRSSAGWWYFNSKQWFEGEFWLFANKFLSSSPPPHFRSTSLHSPVNQITLRRAKASIRCCCRERTWWRAVAKWSSPPSAWTPRPVSSSRSSVPPSTNKNKPSRRWRRVSCRLIFAFPTFIPFLQEFYSRISDLSPLPSCYHWVSLTFLLVFIASHEVFPFVFVLSRKIGMTSKNSNCKLTRNTFHVLLPLLSL